MLSHPEARLRGLTWKKNLSSRINGVPIKSTADFKSELKRAGTALYLQGYYEDYPGDFAYSLALK